MNVINRISLPEAEAAPLVPPDRLNGLYDQVVSFQASNARKWQRRGRFGLMFGGAMFALAAGLSVAVIEMLPLVRVVPVFMQIKDDGLVDTHVTFSALPKSLHVAGIEASLWSYIRLREGYSHAEVQYNYDAVSAMSAPGVREQYQSWINGKSPDNPVVKYGKDASVTVWPVGLGQFTSHSPDYSSGTYKQSFVQILHTQDGGEVRRNMTVGLAYVMADTIPALDRVHYNPDGVIVTEYPGAQPETPR